MPIRTSYAPRMRVVAFVCLAWWLDLGFAVADSPAANYVIRNWGTDEGLPQNSVTSVVQTQDGYLWLGTYHGLARFDGVRFVIFDNNNTPQIDDPGVTALFEAPDGALWIGHGSGELTCYRNGRFESRRPSSHGKAIRGIGSDLSGDIWSLNEAGLLMRERDGLALTAPAQTRNGLVSLVRSAGGDIWVLNRGKISQLISGALVPLVPPAVASNAFVYGVCVARNGGLWAIVGGHLRKWSGNLWSEDLGASPTGTAAINQMFEMSDSRLAVATSENGVFLYRPGVDTENLHFDRTNGIASDWAMAICLDREENLWLGTGGRGLYEFRTASVQVLFPPDHWQGRSVSAVSSDQDGSVWVATEGAGIYRFKQGTWQNYGLGSGLNNLYFWALQEDPQGQLWAGTWGGGLYRWRGAQFEPVASLDADTQHIQSLAWSKQYGLLIGTFTGLLTYSDGKATRCGSKAESELIRVSAIAEDRTGAVWLGTSGDGLYCFKDGQLRSFRKTDGLSSDFIECLYLDDGGALWIGTAGAGLDRFSQGHFTAVSSRQGLPNDDLCHIEEDDNGNFWMGSHAGLIRVRRSDLEKCAEGKTNEIHCLTFGSSEGLPTLECIGGRQPTGFKSADGRIWFSTTKAVVVVDPDKVRLNRLPPPVAIESVLVDDQEALTPGAMPAGPMVIPPGHHHFGFSYTALSFVAPEKVLFKYRLEGLGNNWEAAGTRRSVPYNYVPPGNYVFQVIACNNDGVWNETGAEFAFIVQPYFFQTLWFRFLAVFSLALVIGGGVAVAMRRRMRRKLEHLEQQRALDRERSRIAQDIHDDLGASLTFISLLAETVRGGPAKDSPGVLDRISETARKLTRTMDEIVWAVNPKHDTLESLVSYLSKFAQDYVRAASIRCSFDVPTGLPARSLAAELRHNTFLAFKEALHNVVKHAAASEVSIILTVSAETLTIHINDNGCGFNPDAPVSETADADRIDCGNGLVNIRRRLAEIRGSCDIQSGPGGGTKVSFVIPLKSARRLGGT